MFYVPGVLLPCFAQKATNIKFTQGKMFGRIFVALHSSKNVDV